MNRIARAMFAIAFCAAGALPYAMQAGATESSGAICSPLYPSAHSSKFIRLYAGEFRNIGYNASIGVTCPINVEYDAPSYDIAMVLRNLSGVTKRVTCTLNHHSHLGVKMASVTRNLAVPPGSFAVATWLDTAFADGARYFNVNCSLPPRTVISYMYSEAFY